MASDRGEVWFADALTGPDGTAAPAPRTQPQQWFADPLSEGADFDRAVGSPVTVAASRPTPVPVLSRGGVRVAMARPAAIPRTVVVPRAPAQPPASTPAPAYRSVRVAPGPVRPGAPAGSRTQSAISAQPRPSSRARLINRRRTSVRLSVIVAAVVLAIVLSRLLQQSGH